MDIPPIVPRKRRTMQYIPCLRLSVVAFGNIGNLRNPNNMVHHIHYKSNYRLSWEENDE